MGRWQKHHGFTLIELLIAITAFSFIIAGGYAALNSLVRVWGQQQQVADEMQELQAAWFHMEQDLSQIIARKVRDNAGGHLPAVSGGAAQIQAVRSGWSNSLQQQRSELQRFRYRLLNNRLLRAWWLNTDTPAIAADQETVLLEQVRELRFRYLDSNHNWNEQWQADTQISDILPNAGLPLAIEVSLVLEDGRVYRRLFATVALN